MESKYRLKVTPAAENDLDQIFYYISNSLIAPVSAQNLMDKIEDSMKGLCDLPYKYESLTYQTRKPMLMKKPVRSHSTYPCYLMACI